jgi:hypothetical protein
VVEEGAELGGAEEVCAITALTATATSTAAASTIATFLRIYSFLPLGVEGRIRSAAAPQREG